MKKNKKSAVPPADSSSVLERFHQPSEFRGRPIKVATSTIKRKRPDTRDKIRLRIRGGKLLQAGQSPKVVAESLGVSLSTAYRWRDELDEKGIDSLAMLNRGGAARVLDEKQTEILEQEIVKGPREHGFNYDRWSLVLIGRLIEKKFGLDLDDKAVSRLLKQMELGVNWANSLARYRQKKLASSKLCLLLQGMKSRRQ